MNKDCWISKFKRHFKNNNNKMQSDYDLNKKRKCVNMRKHWNKLLNEQSTMHKKLNDKQDNLKKLLKRGMKRS